MARRTANMLLVIHHMGCAGWSLGVVWEDVGALYGAGVAGPSLRVTFAKFHAKW